MPYCSINIFSQVGLVFILLIQSKLKCQDTKRPADGWKHISTAHLLPIPNQITKHQHVPSMCVLPFLIQRLKQIWSFCLPFGDSRQKNIYHYLCLCFEWKGILKLWKRADMTDGDDSQWIPLSFVATSVGMSFSSCRRNIKGQLYGTLFFI